MPFVLRLSSFFLAFFASIAVANDVNAGFNAYMAAQVMVDRASHSWEWGTAAEALLELYNPELSVFGPEPFPGGKIPNADPSTFALRYARRHINRYSQILVSDTAVGDPASLGVSAILLGQSENVYLGASKRQAEYLLNSAPRWSNGAISHRSEEAELWIDSMAMSFPFLAYQAVQDDDASLMAETVRQCGLYRDVLQPSGTLNWRHIVGPMSPDHGLWSTGNGWAGYGMVRVLHTLQKWPRSASMLWQAQQLKTWIKEILDGAMLSGFDGGLLRNYLNDDSWFGEISGTAMLSAMAYRMAVNDPAMFPQRYITWADTNRKALSVRQGRDGVFVPAVNPYAWLDRKPYYDGSSEGQAFAVHLYTAYRDCVNAKVCAEPPSSAATVSKQGLGPRNIVTILTSPITFTAIPDPTGTVCAAPQSCDDSDCNGAFDGLSKYPTCTGNLEGYECTQLAAGPTPARPRSINGARDVSMDVDASPSHAPSKCLNKFGSGPQKGDTRIVVIVYGEGQDKIVSVFADVLGKPFGIKSGFKEVSPADQGVVVGIAASHAQGDIASRDKDLVVAIHAHCVNLGMPPDLHLSSECDYEFLYTEAPFFRRDLSRFISFTLGQINHHETLMAKPRTYFISTTFPDVSAALPNLDILTVGADAVEIRVDLLQEPLGDGNHSAIPSLSYIGQQVMLLRQRTELPIIFTTRCTRENGRFPMENPELYYEYLYRAIQWGVEYIDVELWLPEDIRQRLFQRRGNSRIMSAFHDFSGTFRWPSTHAQQVYAESRKYADIIKMITIINDHHENFELEYFRSKMRAEYPDSPPFSGVNMGETGQFSRTLNRVFTPITHPLLPIVAAPGQMSASEINAALALLGQLPKKTIWGITSPSFRSWVPQAPFYEKCFNELGLPHHFAVVERQPNNITSMEAWCNQKNFGGAYLSPPISWTSLLKHSPFFASLNQGKGPELTEAARVIGTVDTIVVKTGSSSSASSAPPQCQLEGHLECSDP
ncbi:Pentafunctional AROM polypeptide like protein [Verticillium longisporum]|nr:Pentafunctional AROM polypeptide like protein [Verticillium longisporum]